MSQDITLCASTVCPNITQCHRATAMPKLMQSYADFYVCGELCESFWPIQKEEKK